MKKYLYPVGAALVASIPFAFIYMAVALRHMSMSDKLICVAFISFMHLVIGVTAVVIAADAER